jgi:hypothetical protein
MLSSQHSYIGAHEMISDKIRSLILGKDPNYTYCSLSSHLLTDNDLIELAELASQNPYIACIDLEYNPDITVAGATCLIQSLPNVKIINCDCFLTIEEAMEQSTKTRRIPSVSLGAVFLNSFEPKASPLVDDDQSLSNQQRDSVCKF